VGLSSLQAPPNKLSEPAIGKQVVKHLQTAPQPQERLLYHIHGIAYHLQWHHTDDPATLRCKILYLHPLKSKLNLFITSTLCRHWIDQSSVVPVFMPGVHFQIYAHHSLPRLVHVASIIDSVCLHSSCNITDKCHHFKPVSYLVLAGSIQHAGRNPAFLNPTRLVRPHICCSFEYPTVATP
jgi:hypothetical protein